MNGRISRQQMFIEMAHIVAKRSTCMRLNVGAVLVEDNSVVSIGYNGAPSGEPHCAGHDCPGWTSVCKRTIHAEMNALIRAPQGLFNLDLYVTHSPCSHCWTELWRSGRVNRVFFSTPYRNTDHLVDTLFHAEVYQVLPSGGVVDYATGRMISAL